MGILWTTKSDGAFRCVRLTERLAIKTPYVFKVRYLCQLGQRQQKPTSPLWWFRQWWACFTKAANITSRKRRRWKRIGAQEVNKVTLCPVLRSQRWGLLVVMPRAAPLGRHVSIDEDMTAAHLIDKRQDTGKESTFGILDGKVVIVDYG
jgi:hypothetical protein